MKKWVLFKLNNSLGQLYSALGVKNVTDDNDLMIINQSGIVIRLAVADCRVMGRATQGVRLINLAKKNDVFASVCKGDEFRARGFCRGGKPFCLAKNSEEIENDTCAPRLPKK